MSGGCDKIHPQVSESTTRETSVLKSIPSRTAKQAGESIVDQCRETYRYLYGEGGCLANRLSADDIDTACRAYAAWDERDDACAAQSFASFFSCLREADCEIFDSEDEGAEEDGIGLGGLFSACRRRFAKDMDICINAQKTEDETN